MGDSKVLFMCQGGEQAISPQGRDRFLSSLVCVCRPKHPFTHCCVTLLDIYTTAPRTPTFPYSHTTQRLAMAIDEATQTNGVAQPDAGHLKKDEAEKSTWSVESGMS
jgi:hypothetical protein